jgi:hypothetical protein
MKFGIHFVKRNRSVKECIADESEDSPSMMQERERDRSRPSASTISGKVGPGGRP